MKFDAEGVESRKPFLL